MDTLVAPPKKTGFLRWEADVKVGSVTYTFQSVTKTGATRKAVLFVNSLGTTP
jgi:hypothetical protein